ncbi:MAG: hypothetical protein QM660_08940 [Dysgonomonas sp.]
MDQTILSGLFALGGAIIGGLITIGTTVISNRKQVNLELKKQRIEFLYSKKEKIEMITSELYTYIVDDKNSQVRLHLFNSLFVHIDHYFYNDPKYVKYRDSFINTMNKFGDENYNLNKLNNELTAAISYINVYMTDNLRKTMAALEKEF